ncbi:MAG: DUF4416 family protein [Nitrospinae bacterium]|nr:DUF4416 family protein [Nitrospinota bacterium]
MGKIKYPPSAKLIISIIFRDEEISSLAKGRLYERYGRIDFESDIIPFDFTDYYEREMGRDLKRGFISFNDLIEIESLPEIKLHTNEIETMFTGEEGGRLINIDPGYLSAEKLVLSTTKNYNHRPYLGKGIYAELVYCFYKGSFHPLDWTYPDYKVKTNIEMFNRIRKRYMEQLKMMKVI